MTLERKPVAGQTSQPSEPDSSWQVLTEVVSEVVGAEEAGSSTAKTGVFNRETVEKRAKKLRPKERIIRRIFANTRIDLMIISQNA